VPPVEQRVEQRVEQPVEPDVVALVRALAARGVTVAAAESLTAGLVAARLADVPGASAVLRGGVVAYATPLKAAVLGVDAALLAAGGAVQAEVAEQMASGAARLLGADVGVATTGVAGPEPQDGRPVGTVFVAVAGAGRPAVEQHHLRGGRGAVRRGTVAAALALLARWEGGGAPGR
jgi:nicotinamide-nucleotide amidase